MPNQRLSVQNRKIRAGEVDRTLALPTALGDEDVAVDLTVDDPAADPPTPADFALHVDADTPAGFVPISTFVFSASGTATALVPVRGRTLRVRYVCGIDCTIDLLATAYP